MSKRVHSAPAILVAALEIRDPQARAEFLSDACGNDVALRHEVEELIAADAEAGNFLPDRGLAGPRPDLGGRADTLDSPPASVGVQLTEKPGDRIGRYKLLQKIGEGGCGTVYMAEQEE